MRFQAILFLLISTILFSPVFAQTADNEYNNRSFLLRDEGLSQLSYVSLSEPESNWHQAVPKGRDLQLVGKGRVLIGTESGYEERMISTGEKVSEQTSFPGTIAARKLKNGNILLVGADWQDEKGIVLLEINDNGTIKNRIVYPDYNYARLVRETSENTFIITSNDIVFEGSKDGKILWKANVESERAPHAWQGLRLANGSTILASGYGGSVQQFDLEGNLYRKITGPDEVNPNFYSGMQILSNGNIVIANWQGHGPDRGESGKQLLEYSPDGELVWSWQQDPEQFSSLQGVIVLDGLDTDLLHVEDENGVLNPIE